jgi:phosphoserine phosphatase
MREEEIRAEHFRQAEASFLLEGLDSSSNEHYQKMKALVISGELDIDESIRQTVEHYKALSRASVNEYVVAE